MPQRQNERAYARTRVPTLSCNRAHEPRTEGQTMTNPGCSTESGSCEAAALDPSRLQEGKPGVDSSLIYIGDPMCSWCWGMAPQLMQLRHHCQLIGLPFRVIVGGLRPGGGDPWNDSFKQFLAQHWREISSLTGQPFSYALLDRPEFEYDTEPACRSVVAARAWLDGNDLDFFSAVQQKFYTQNEDPRQSGFYREICAGFGLDFDAFVQAFESDAIKAMTRDEFRQSRALGVASFPTVLLRSEGRVTQIASGYSTFSAMRERVHAHLPSPA